MAAEQAQGVIVFFSYARRDKMLRDRLEDHLSNLKYKGLIQTWHDRDILAGSDWLEQIDISLHNAQIILLLISSTFMASDYCYGKEMQRALQLHAQEKATVIPILLRPVLYAGAPFARLSMLPTNGKPVTSWRDRDSAFVDVALNIEKIALYYLQSRTVKQPALSSQIPFLPGDPGEARGATFRGTSCPYCGAETRPGDNFCLNCGNRLQPSPPSPSQDAWGQPPAPGAAAPGWGAQGNQPQAPAAFDSAAGVQPWGQAAQAVDPWGQAAPQQAPGAPPQAARPGNVAQASPTPVGGRQAYLQIEEGREPGRVYEVRKETVSIGRIRERDISLEDMAVSRLHASLLSLGGGQYALRDEDSANGTKLNGQTVTKYQPYPLREGDTIQIGQTVLIFRVPLTSRPDIQNAPTMAVGSLPTTAEPTYHTRDDEPLTAGSNDEYGTRSMGGSSSLPPKPPPQDVGSMSHGEETLGNADLLLSGEHAHMISEAIRRAYYTESVAAYERILNHTPENDEAWRGLGKALYGLARYDEALDAFRRALLTQATPAAYAGLGDVFLKRKLYSEAVAAYEKARELDRDVTLDYADFIRALREVGRAEEADRMYLRARDQGYFDDALEN